MIQFLIRFFRWLVHEMITKYPVQACTSLKTKWLQAYFLEENVVICSDYWSVRMHSAIVVCFATPGETTTFVCHWLHCPIVLLTEVTGSGPFVGSKPSLNPLDPVQKLDQAELSCSMVLRTLFHASLLALRTLESDPFNACSSWNLNM